VHQVTREIEKLRLATINQVMKEVYQWTDTTLANVMA